MGLPMTMVHPFSGASAAEEDALHAAARAAECTPLETPMAELQQTAESTAARVLQEHGMVPVTGWFEVYTHLGVLIIAQRKRVGSSSADRGQMQLL